jgi:hypothetical protein
LQSGEFRNIDKDLTRIILGGYLSGAAGVGRPSARKKTARTPEEP